MKAELIVREAISDEDIHQILALQRVNIRPALSPEIIERDGFLTCEHDFELLNKMNSPHRHTVCLHQDVVIGYCLVMLPEWRAEICVLQSMFEQLDQLRYMDRALSPKDYVIVGQVCVGEDFRGRGIFRKLYDDYYERLSGYFNYCITEVDANNVRSLNAHKAIGFTQLHRYQPGDGHDWVLLIWDWAKPGAIVKTTSNP